MINVWAFICTPSIVSSLGDQIHLFVCILLMKGKKSKTNSDDDAWHYLTCLVSESQTINGRILYCKIRVNGNKARLLSYYISV
jgi:hypothetical protein